MNKTLIPLLATFNDEEWKNCGRFLDQAHSSESKIFKVYSFLRLNKKDVGKFADIFKVGNKHFPDTSQAGFTKLISKLFIECERFILTYTLQHDQNKSDLYLNEIYNSRGLFNLADRKATKLTDHIKNKSTYALSDQQVLTQLLHQQCYSDNPIKYEKEIRLQQDLFQNYFKHVQWQSFTYLCEAQNWSNITQQNLEKEVEILEQTIALLPKNELSELFKKLLRVIKDLDVVSFLGVRKELYDGKFEIPDQLHSIVTMYLINSCIKLWRKGTYVDGNENAKLIEYGLSTGVLTSSGKIPITRFLNLLSTLGKLKTYQWNEEFIKRWVDHVDTKSHESTYAFATALNAFNFGKYELIHPLLREVEFENYSEKIRALGLEMISLYIDRKDNYYVLRNFISNYKRTLKRAKEKISSTNVKAYLNLVKVIELLIQKDFRRLTIKLEKYQPIAYRSWVVEEVGRR